MQESIISLYTLQLLDCGVFTIFFIVVVPQWGPLFWLFISLQETRNPPTNIQSPEEHFRTRRAEINTLYSSLGDILPSPYFPHTQQQTCWSLMPRKVPTLSVIQQQSNRNKKNKMIFHCSSLVYASKIKLYLNRREKHQKKASMKKSLTRNTLLYLNIQ